MRKRKKSKNRFIRVATLITLIVVAVVVGIKVNAGTNDITEKAVQAAQSNDSSNSSSSNATKKKLIAKWRKILSQTDSSVKIAVYDKNAKQTYTLTNNGSGTYNTASIVKVAILAQILHNAQENGTTLSETDKEYAVKMIENSDNTAATYLFQNVLGGADGLNELFTNLNMKDSSANSAWGMTTTTANDQLKLLNNIFYSSDYLSTTSQNYIKTLMANTASDQSWGVSAGSSESQLKNGWLSLDGSWIINSIGHVGSDNSGYTIAVMTYGNSDQASGEALVEQLAKATSSILNEN